MHASTRPTTIRLRLPVPLSPLQRAAFALALRTALAGRYFDLSALGRAAAIVGRNVWACPDYPTLAALHCMAWTDIAPSVRAELAIVIKRTLGLVNVPPDRSR